MSLQGFSLTDVGAEQRIGEQSVLEAVRLAIPDEAMDAAIAEAGARAAHSGTHQATPVRPRQHSVSCAPVECRLKFEPCVRQACPHAGIG